MDRSESGHRSRKTKLELEMLELQVDMQRARKDMTTLERDKAAAELRGLILENERRQREKDQADQQRTKLGLEVSELRARPHWLWNRAQYTVVILGVVVSAATYWKSVRESHDKDIQVAAEHLQNGYPSGAVELGRYDDALGILVKSVDASHKTVQKSWPAVTRAALDEVYRRRQSLTDADKKFLRRGMNENHAEIIKLLVKRTSSPSVPEPVQTQLPPLQDYVCVQLSLQSVLGPPPPDGWQSTYEQVRGQLLGDPDC